METGSLADRYAGVLLGLACGDALGGPVEFLSREDIVSRHPEGVREFIGGGWLDLAPGEVTDDTQQTLILAEALTERGLDIDRFAAGMLSWYRSAPKDIGNTTRVALEALAAGTLPLEAGAVALAKRGDRGSAANGAAMRCAPVALRFRRQPEALVRASLDSARVTHAEPRAAWATVAVNQAIVHLLEGGPIAGAPDAAVLSIANHAIRAGVLGAATREREDVRAGGFVLETIGAAFWALLRAENAREAVEADVALGDDADSTGAAPRRVRAPGFVAGWCAVAPATPGRGGAAAGAFRVKHGRENRDRIQFETLLRKARKVSF